MPDPYTNGECTGLADVDIPLVCHLPDGHTGFHYDATDDITWQKGQPDA